MAFRMSYLHKRDDSNVFWFRKRTPTKFLNALTGRKLIIEFPPFRDAQAYTADVTVFSEIKFSLATKDREIAEEREALARAHLARVFETEVRGPRPLTNQQLHALGGEVYRLITERFDADPGHLNVIEAWKAFNRAAWEGRIGNVPAGTLELIADERGLALREFGENLTAGVNALPQSLDTVGLERRFGCVTQWVLTKHGIAVDRDTWVKLLKAVGQAMVDAGWRLRRAAEGDYSPDPKAERFPPISVLNKESGSINLDTLFDRWRKEVNPAASTITTWRGSVKLLKEYVLHQDCSKITSDCIIGWKNWLLDRELSTKTINDTHLAAIKRLFVFGVNNRLVTSNPAEGVKVEGKAKAGKKKLPYTDEEVGRLLGLARAETKPCRRWLPWLAAVTGARIGELAQLWRENVRREGECWVIDIRPAPDGGSLKNEGSERTVPLHPALIEEGFVTFIEGRAAGPLFYAGHRSKSKSEVHLHASKGVTNRLATWIRSKGFNDERKAPAHALRHWWKTAAARASVQDSVADAIQGHAPSAEAGTYRHIDVTMMARAMQSIELPAIVQAPLPEGHAARPGGKGPGGA